MSQPKPLVKIPRETDEFPCPAAVAVEPAPPVLDRVRGVQVMPVGGGPAANFGNGPTDSGAGAGKPSATAVPLNV
jgi:hypothetical protein